jgi:uncharacterized membrane protein
MDVKEVLSVPGLHGRRVNVSAGERLLSVFAGGILAGAAIRNRSWAGAALGVGSAALLWRGFTGVCPAYLTAGVNTDQPAHTSQRTEHVVTVMQPPEKVYQYWRNLENLPKIMRYLDSVRVVDDRTSIWRAKGPAGKTIEWEAMITDDVANERIEWQSTGKATVPNTGTVTFRRAPGDRGTEVRVVLEYQPPAGKVGETVAIMTGRSASREIREDLRRFKQMMETGEVPTTEGQPSGHRS